MCREFLELQNALLLFAEVYANLWPLDPTPRLLLKTLVHYQYATGFGSERDRCRLMEEFLDEVLRESAGRANRGKPPLAFRQLKERWRDFIERAGAKYKSSSSSSDKAGSGVSNAGSSAGNNSASSQQKGGQGGGQNSGRGRGGKGPRSGLQHRSGALRHQGKLICYLYNNKGPGCQRPVVNGGCDDGKGGIFAHVCNFVTSPGQVCAAAHPRSKNH